MWKVSSKEMSQTTTDRFQPSIPYHDEASSRSILDISEQGFLPLQSNFLRMLADVLGSFLCDVYDDDDGRYNLLGAFFAVSRDV